MADPPKHFFKFIPPAFKHNYLSIPRSFLPYLNGGRCSKAILRRGSHEWPVDITDGGFSGDGWKKCLRENGVQEFDFMIFKHQGNLVFDFLVFDPSTCEKQYPNIFDVEEPLTESDSIISTNRLRKLKTRKRNNYASQKEEKIRVGNDRCFIRKMTPYYIKTSRLHVPVNFVRSMGSITERKRKQLIIRDETRRRWSATLHINNKMRFSSLVWREFTVENHLEVGDNCMFELVKDGVVPVLNFYNLGNKPIKEANSTKKKAIRAFRVVNESKERKANFAPKERATPREEDHHRYFVGKLKAYSIKQSLLLLPPKFVKNNGLVNDVEIILRNVEDKRPWIVKVKHYANKSCYIARGWKDFRVANGLKEGNRFKLEIVDKTGEKIIANFYGKKSVNTNN